MNKKIKEEFVPINGINQYILHHPSPNNSKDVVIMLHGGPGIPNSYIAYYQQPYQNFCNFVYYDQRGAGKTRLKNKEVTSESLSLDILLEDLRQTIQYIKEEYQTQRIFLNGHSWGNVLGGEYVRKYSKDVVGFIASGVCVDMTATDRSWYQHLKKVVMESGNKRDIKKFNKVNPAYPNISSQEYAKATSQLSSLEFKYGYSPIDWMKIYRKSPLMNLREGMQMNSAEMFNYKILEVLHGYNIREVKEYHLPVYYLLGRQDEWTTSTVAAEYFDTFTAPKKKLYWIENAGHEADLDNPTDFFKAIEEIVTEN